MNANELRAIVGDDKFNQLLDSLNDTQQRGKLRYWQEQLFESVADETGGQISFDQFVTIMRGAAPAIREVSMEEFLSDPISLWRDKTVRLDPSWIKDAWRLPDFMDAILDECLCSVALTDSLNGLCRDVSMLAALTPEDGVHIYKHVARWCCMTESEWRDNFLRALPAIEDLVPPESGVDATSLITNLRSEWLSLEGPQVRPEWLVVPRLVTAGSRECWLILETTNAFGLLYAPYGSLEPQYKWGVACDVAFECADDQTWVASFSEGIEVLIADSI